MPKDAERRIKAQGGARKWRTVKRDGQAYRVAVTRKEGPRGGKTVMYPIETKEPAGKRGKSW